MNKVLTTEFDILILERMSYAQLDKFVNDLLVTINTLEQLKLQAVIFHEDEKAVKYQKWIHNATSNREAMIVVMLGKEADMCEHHDLETIWLN